MAIGRVVRASVHRLLGRETGDAGCRCRLTFPDETLRIDANECPGGARLANAPACRTTVVDTLTEGDARRIVACAGGQTRTYENDGVRLLNAAGHATAALAEQRPRLSTLARRDPLAAADELDRHSRSEQGVIARLAAFAGSQGYRTLLNPTVRPSVSHWRVRRSLPSDAVLSDTRRLSTGSTVRLYSSSVARVPRYHLRPLAADLDRQAWATVERARRRLARSAEADLSSNLEAVVRRVAGSQDSIPDIATVLRKHTSGYGLLEDFFADPVVSDVFVTAPACDNRVRIRADGRTVTSNARLTDAGVAALASRFRRESGRAFSRATPTLDAATEIAGRRVRIAGVTEPVSDGYAFAFRAHDREHWTLADLVANETMVSRCAALLALAMRRGRSVLIVGARGSGKTTLLSALLWELPAAVRTMLIEDTPESPVTRLQAAGRDVQAFRAAAGGSELSPEDALRTALRMGDGALVLGEIRGEEADVLYEAMRVGANSEAVLGTVHGDGAMAAHDRVVEDLGVEPGAFGETDVIVTTESADGPMGTTRRVRRVEEVSPDNPSRFQSVFDRSEGQLRRTGRIERGNSHLVTAMATPQETYSDVRNSLQTEFKRFRPEALVADSVESRDK